MPPFFDAPLGEELRFILNLGVAVLAALLGGAIAARLRQPTVVGYLLAGIVIGPFTPGFVGDQGQITALADVGVVLLLFALGVQFPLRELVAVRGVAVGAAILQIAATTAIGAVAAAALGFDPRSAIVMGVTLAISSTIVVVKILVERGELEAAHGRALVGWMIVQDLATIVVAASLPALAGGDPLGPLLLAAGRVALFLGLAYVIGTRLLPAGFRLVARLGSSELFLLAVIGTALVAAVTSSAVFGLGLALGAFVAGLLIAESELSYQAVAEIVPFRDLFAVLFFVSVGMLVDPASIAAQAGLVLVFVLVAVVAKGLLATGLARLFGLPARSAILLGAILAQVGEFSFILAEEALGLGILAKQAYDVLLGTAVVSIILTPFAVRGADRLVGVLERRRRGGAPVRRRAGGRRPGSGRRARQRPRGAGRVHLGWPAARRGPRRGSGRAARDPRGPDARLRLRGRGPRPTAPRGSCPPRRPDRLRRRRQPDDPGAGRAPRGEAARRRGRRPVRHPARHGAGARPEPPSRGDGAGARRPEPGDPPHRRGPAHRGSRGGGGRGAGAACPATDGRLRHGARGDRVGAAAVAVRTGPRAAARAVISRRLSPPHRPASGWSRSGQSPV